MDEELHRLVIRVELDEAELIVAGTEFKSMDRLEQMIADITDKIITSIKVKRDGTLKLSGKSATSDSHFIVDNECIDSFKDKDA